MIQQALPQVVWATEQTVCWQSRAGTPQSSPMAPLAASALQPSSLSLC